MRRKGFFNSSPPTNTTELCTGQNLHNLIIYGGTFDPIHEGHLKTALAVQQHFNFERFLFLPCKTPVLKNQATATAKQRIAMLKLAIASFDTAFEIDLTEINRESPSYMYHTLASFRHALGKHYSISLLLGADSFSQLPQWHNWEKILELANLLVIQRSITPPNPISSELIRLLQQHETQNEQAILHHSQGCIYRYDAGHFDISSSKLRQQIAAGKTPIGYLPETVWQYIQEKQLYRST